MSYRSLSKDTIWRRAELEDTLELQAPQEAGVNGLAATLASLSHIPLPIVSRRIDPKTNEELEDLLRFWKTIKDFDAEKLTDPMLFCRMFLAFNPADYQEELLRESAKRIVIRMSRQSGKTFTFAAKAIFYCITHPGALVIIVASNLDQSMVTAERLATHLGNMPLPVHKAWIKEQKS